MLSIPSIDAYQRTHPWLGLPLAVRRKYAEDRGGNLAAAISYYAFLSIFPLLVVLVSVLAYALPGHPGFDHTIVASALGRFPIVGTQLRAHSLRGSGLGIGLGLAGSLWAGSRVVLALESAVDKLWGVPPQDQPGFVGSRVRALALLGGLALAVIATAALGGLDTVGSRLGIAGRIGAILCATVLDSLVFWVGFHVLSGGKVDWRSLRGGAVAAGIGYEALQLVGGLYVRHVLERASTTYGTFTLVIGLLSWIYLLSARHTPCRRSERRHEAPTVATGPHVGPAADRRRHAGARPAGPYRAAPVGRAHGGRFRVDAPAERPAGPCRLSRS